MSAAQTDLQYLITLSASRRRAAQRLAELVLDGQGSTPEALTLAQQVYVPSADTRTAPRTRRKPKHKEIA